MISRESRKKLQSNLSFRIEQFGIDKFTSNLVSLILFVTFLYNTIRYSSEIFAGGHPYLTGDWLINYEGGYSGRGLNGQLLLSISDLTHFNLLWLTYFEQVLIYGIYALTVILILRRVKDKFLWMISLSPLFIMFDFLDTGGSFRKEIIGFACIAVVIRMNLRDKFTWLSFLPPTLLFILASFSWEANVILLVPTLYFIFQMNRSGILSRPKFVAISFFYTTISFLSLVCSFTLQLNSSKGVSRAICSSLMERGISGRICDGTIFSTTGLSLSIFETLHYLVIENNFGYYIPLLAFAIIPFIWNGWISRHPLISSGFFLSVLPIFLIGLDWGRWIHILGTLITLAWIVENTQESKPPKGKQIKKSTTAFVILSLLFTILWRIPHAGGLPGAVFFGALARVISWL